ncbi:MAG: B12-binding domain-containing radical SAM protein [Clostridia bacterium]|nr:B12-binding domain-containing radical SAM protein [Clostridia bacterium]
MVVSSRKIKRVLLITPPAFTFADNIDINPVPPLGLAYIAAVLEKNGIEVKIVDSLIEGWDNRVVIHDNVIRVGLNFDEIKDIITEFSPDIVGVSNLFSKQSENAHAIHAKVKEIDKNIITVAGGAHPTVMPEKVLSDNNVDFVIMGEGEFVFIDLIREIEGQQRFDTLDGVGYHDAGEIRINPKTSFIENLDEIPFPARHLLNMEKYYGLNASHGERRKRKFSPIITSRGCPANCTFCSAHKVWGKRYRYRSAENVVAEMKELKEKFGIEELMFEDDNLTLNPKRAEKIFDMMIEQKLDFVWDTPNGVAAYSLNEALIDKMKLSGCYNINLAVETGNQYIMDNVIKKPLKLENVKPIIEYARKIKIKVGIFLVIGMPGETVEQIWDSFRFARELKIYYPHISVATPYPGSVLYDTCVENKYISETFSTDDLYIRSFSITTENWDGDKLQQLLQEGHEYLLAAYFRDNPIKFMAAHLPKLVVRPLTLMKKTFRMLKAAKGKG